MNDMKAWDALREHQRQLDEEGIYVGVSRQAINETLDYIAELEKRIAEMEGEGYVTAAEYLNDWWHQSNVQGVATMSGEELLFICEEFLSYGKDGQPTPTDEQIAVVRRAYIEEHYDDDAEFYSEHQDEVFEAGYRAALQGEKE